MSSYQKRFFIALSLYPFNFFANTPFKRTFNVNMASYFQLELQPLKLCLIKYQLDIPVFFLKLLIFICGFSTKVTCAFLGLKINEEMIKIKHFSSQKNEGVFHIFDRFKFQGFCCKSGIEIFEITLTVPLIRFILQNQQ